MESELVLVELAQAQINNRARAHGFLAVIWMVLFLVAEAGTVGLAATYGYLHNATFVVCLATMLMPALMSVVYIMLATAHESMVVAAYLRTVVALAIAGVVGPLAFKKLYVS